jgi:hypothetical protein
VSYLKNPAATCFPESKIEYCVSAQAGVFVNKTVWSALFPANTKTMCR